MEEELEKNEKYNVNESITNEDKMQFEWKFLLLMTKIWRLLNSIEKSLKTSLDLVTVWSSLKFFLYLFVE